MDNHYANNESNENNTQNSKEDSKKTEEREDKVKKYNAHEQLMNGQNKSVDMDHFDG